MRIYPKRLISRIKGALMAGLKPKQLAYWTGIPLETIRSWAREDCCGAVPADPAVLEDVRIALLKEN